MVNADLDQFHENQRSLEALAKRDLDISELVSLMKDGRWKALRQKYPVEASDLLDTVELISETAKEAFTSSAGLQSRGVNPRLRHIGRLLPLVKDKRRRDLLLQALPLLESLSGGKPSEVQRIYELTGQLHRHAEAQLLQLQRTASEPHKPYFALMREMLDNMYAITLVERSRSGISQLGMTALAFLAAASFGLPILPLKTDTGSQEEQGEYGVGVALLFLFILVFSMSMAELVSNNWALFGMLGSLIVALFVLLFLAFPSLRRTTKKPRAASPQCRPKRKRVKKRKRK